MNYVVNFIFICIFYHILNSHELRKFICCTNYISHKSVINSFSFTLCKIIYKFFSWLLYFLWNLVLNFFIVNYRRYLLFALLKIFIFVISSFFHKYRWAFYHWSFTYIGCTFCPWSLTYIRNPFCVAYFCFLNNFNNFWTIHCYIYSWTIHCYIYSFDIL